MERRKVAEHKKTAEDEKEAENKKTEENNQQYSRTPIQKKRFPGTQLRRNQFWDLRSWKKTTCIYLLAFAVPFLIMGIAFAAVEIYPFGSRQVLVIDAWHQYYPFLTELYRKLRSGESLLYSWKIGMGSGFLPLAAYYLASPLNLLLLLFPEAFLREGFTLLILIKIGISGLCCAFSLNRMNRKDDYGLVIFSTLYALCSWAIGYYWNIMWLDTFALFPLVALGTCLLIKEKKYKLYTISLAAAIFTNYYMGLMVCIFTALYFFAQCIIQKITIREAFLHLKNIIVFSVLSIMISAPVLLPTITALKEAYHSSYRPEKWQAVRGWIETLANTLAYGKPTFRGGLPNLYCGVACILFLFLFYRLKEVSRREKMVHTVLILFLFISTNINLLDYAWHGFHFTNSLPYRFTFLLSFLLAMLAYRAYSGIGQLKKADGLVACLAGAGYYLLIAADKIIRLKKENPSASFSAAFTQDGGFGPLLAKNLLLILAYLLLILFAVRKKLPKTAFPLLLAVLVGLELVPTVMAGTKAVMTTDRDGYPQKYSEVQEILEGIQKEEGGNNFYRTEFTDLYVWNDAVLYGFPGLSAFSSTVNVAVTDLFDNLGLFSWQAANRYHYQNSTPVNNAFLNLKYLISRGKELTNLEYLTEFARGDGIYAYQNDVYLPVGFMVENAMGDFAFEGDTPFEKQNNLIKAAAGIDKEVFQALDIIHVGHQNLYVTRPGYGTYRYVPSEDASPLEKGKFKFNYEMPADGCAYVYMELSGAKKAQVESGGSLQEYEIDDRGNFFPAGTYQKGDIFSVRSEIEAGKSGNLKIFVGVLDQEAFEEAYGMLKDEVLEVEEFTSKSLSGTITAKKDGLLYTSIPYEKGWKAYVDGKQAEITLIADALIGVALPAGEHRVEIRYMPGHVYLSLFLSLAGAGIFAFISILDQKKKQGRADQ